MKKHFIVIGMMLMLLVVGLSGCVEEENMKPTLTISITPTNPEIGDLVKFYSYPNDEDGTIESYMWDFGDGDISGIKNPTHSYTKQGTFMIICTVTDDNGDTASENYNLTVNATNQDEDFFNWFEYFLFDDSPDAIVNIYYSWEQIQTTVDYIEDAEEMYNNAKKELRDFTVLSPVYEGLKTRVEVYIDQMLYSLTYLKLYILETDYYDAEEYLEEFNLWMDKANEILDTMYDTYWDIDE